MSSVEEYSSEKFSSGGSGFDPSFSETEKVRVVCIDQIG